MLNIIRPKQHSDVQACEKRLCAAQEELRIAETSFSELKAKADQARQAAIEAEALAEIGELDPKEAEKARKAANKAVADFDAIEDVKARKRAAVRILTERVEEATAKARQEQVAAIEKAMRERIEAARKAFAAADAANEALFEVEREAAEIGLKYPSIHASHMRHVFASGANGVLYEGITEKWERNISDVVQRLGLKPGKSDKERLAEAGF